MDLQQFHDMELRCTQEDMPRCAAACPLHVDVRGIMAFVRKGDFNQGYARYAQTVPFPRILSRICDHPCEGACLRSGLGAPDAGLAIRALEQACVTYNKRFLPNRPLRTRKDERVAVIGAGLSGLTAAQLLAAKGFRVTVLDAGIRPGGRLAAFSEDTLPKDAIEADFAILAHLGIEMRCDTVVGSHAAASVRLDELAAQYDAIYLAPGACDFRELAPGLELDAQGYPVVDEMTLATSMPKVFAGGSWRHNGSFIHAVCDGRAAMISIDRLLQGASLTSSRVKDGPLETGLFTSTEGVTPEPVTPMADPSGYSQQEARAEAGRCLDCQCLECVKLCEYMKQYKTASPRQLARQIFKNMSGVGGHRFNQQMNSCSLCRQCEAVCAQDFSMADICHAARESLVRQGKMPPSAFDFALADMRYSASDAFQLTRHAPGTSSSAWAFFPGCQLSGAAPWQVQAVYGYLADRLSDGVGLMLGCCGVQADWAGESVLFLEALENVREQWLALGRPTIITACPTCYMVFRKHLPEVQVEALVPLIERLGLPKDLPALPDGLTLALHDSCTTRYETDLQDSARRLLAQLGVTVAELPTNRSRTECCGFGGLMQISNRDLAHKVMDRRTGESPLDFVVYCSMCRENFSHRGKTTWHVLDLIFGDAEGRVRPRPASGYSQRHDNRARLKKELLAGVWGESVTEEALLPLHISDEVRAVMEKYLILDADVRAVISYAERSGNALKNTVTGHTLASYKPAHVTYWADYTMNGDGSATVHDAWCHRLEIVGLASTKACPFSGSR